MKNNLKLLFTSQKRVDILKFILSPENKDVRFYQREMMRIVGGEHYHVRREIKNLEKIGLLKDDSKNHTLGMTNKVYYKVNCDSKFYKPLQLLFNFQP